eukprot:1141858-Pelagomonas_calceolata.AAC.1
MARRFIEAGRMSELSIFCAKFTVVHTCDRYDTKDFVMHFQLRRGWQYYCFLLPSRPIDNLTSEQGKRC